METKKQVFEDIKRQGYITKQQVDLLKTRGNHDNEYMFLAELLETEQFKHGIPLSPDHNKEELARVHELAYTPKGSIKSTCPFKQRELEIINKETVFNFLGFLNNGTRDLVNLTPMYEIGGIEYYDDNGIHVVGETLLQD